MIAMSWAIGRYVVMPNHVHFFCSAELGAKTLPVFLQAWKQWTSKRITRELNLIRNCLAAPKAFGVRPCLALKRELQPEVGLRKGESSARRLG